MLKRIPLPMRQFTCLNSCYQRNLLLQPVLEKFPLPHTTGYLHSMRFQAHNAAGGCAQMGNNAQ
ncbi:MAG: hypothetical protein IPL28_09285 [Chloroflexi bacterium]|nr:hypothetical protein [Chloroflexota bacterium]